MSRPKNDSCRSASHRPLAQSTRLDFHTNDPTVAAIIEAIYSRLEALWPDVPFNAVTLFVSSSGKKGKGEWDAFLDVCGNVLVRGNQGDFLSPDGHIRLLELGVLRRSE